MNDNTQKVIYKSFREEEKKIQIVFNDLNLILVPQKKIIDVKK